jgi:ABC-type bacteriocin/lantibiotic exporter with double-glycine peptidase domain
MLFVSFAEILSISAVLPFLGALTAPEQLYSNLAFQPIIKAFGVTKPEQLLLPLTIGFIVAILIAGAIRLLLLWASTHLSFMVGAELSFNMFQRTLHQPYSVHLARNSSEVINGVTNKANTVTNSIFMSFIIINSILSILAILFALVVIDPIIAISAFCGFGFLYAIVIRMTRNQLLINSQCIANESTRLFKVLQEGLGAIRDILIDGSQDKFCNTFRDTDLKVRLATRKNTFISASPRYIMEALSIILVTVIAYFLVSQPDGIAMAIPVIGALALGAQRLIPLMQQTFAAWAIIKSNQISIEDAILLLDQAPPKDHGKLVEPVAYFNSISLHNISFRYSQDAPWVLRGINLRISKGSRIGFIGATGSGKSTLLDIMMGLLPPTIGSVVIDDQAITLLNLRSWQSRIAHVPPSIFLTDGTIEENIAFGLSKGEIDHQRVVLAAQHAQLSDVIETWPHRYQTLVGERGARLSSGQRQRIGIARALYKKADVIIFDEATSALDMETERAVIEAIEGLSQDLTILIIAHRLSTLKNCAEVVELRDGTIVRIGTYQQIVTQTASNLLGPKVCEP